MRQVYNLVELFSGIGSQAMALKNNGVNVRLINTCEWNIHAIIAYDAIHNENCSILSDIGKMKREELIEQLSCFSLSNDGKTKLSNFMCYTDETLKKILSAIKRNRNLVDITQMKGNAIRQSVDILTYSFPCQDLSNVGAFHGYQKGIDKDSGSRSALLWQVGRILNEMNNNGVNLPRFLLLENVPTLESKRHKHNFEQWKNDLIKLGYHNHVYLLNAKNYGIPQNRPRLIMISVLIGNKEKELEQLLEEYYEQHNIADLEYIASLNIEQKKLSDLLKLDYSKEYLFNEAKEAQPNDTPSRVRIWEENPQLTDKNGVIIKDHIRTLTTKQDRNPNSGNIYFDYEGNTKAKYRFLTPRECFVLMGFQEKDYENVMKNNFGVRRNSKMFTRDVFYKLCGNSIPVKMLEQVFRQIIEIDEKIMGKNKKQALCITSRSGEHKFNDNTLRFVFSFGDKHIGDYDENEEE